MATAVPLGTTFWSKVDRRAPDECWLWRGPVGPGGYGRAYLLGKRQHAHRIAFRLTNGKDAYPFALHRCDVRLCCNPAHLWEGDHKANMEDMVAKGRWKNQYTGDNPRPLKTHCVHGHEFTLENCYFSKGYRFCRACSRDRNMRRDATRKQQQERAA